MELAYRLPHAHLEDSSYSPICVKISASPAVSWKLEMFGLAKSVSESVHFIYNVATGKIILSLFTHERMRREGFYRKSD